MKIKHIEISNFKSFEKIELDLGNFNVLLGTNASGKSNFVNIFRFIRNIEQMGLNNAISKSGGADFFRNLNIGSNAPFRISITCSILQNINVKIFEVEIIYEFILDFDQEGKYNLLQENFIYSYKTENYDFNYKISINNNESPKVKLKESEQKVNNIQEAQYEFVKIPILFEDTIKFYLDSKQNDQILLETPIPKIISGSLLSSNFYNIAIYDFDTKIARKSTSNQEKSELEEDGTNIAVVLKSILKNEKKRRSFLNLTKLLLKFIEDLEVKPLSSAQLSFMAKEIYQERLLPAEFLSDGTINIICLIVALFFEDKDIIIIEEPERYIHPKLISRIVNFMEDVASNKQIIITTHSPEIVRWAKNDNILFISRNKQGFSEISRPVDEEIIRDLLKDEVGLDELFIDNLLGMKS